MNEFEQVDIGTLRQYISDKLIGLLELEWNKWFEEVENDILN